MKNWIFLCVMVVSACGKGSGGGNSDKLGGEESIKDSFSCVLKLPSPGKDGSDDKVRGFNVKVTAFIYSKGSVAATLESTYIFSKDQSDTTVVSRLFPQNETKHNLSTDLLLAKIDVKDKAVELFKKYDVGDSYSMEDCK